MASRPLRLLLGLGMAETACASAIDPAIYASIFEMNQPMWSHVSAELQKLGLPNGARVLDVGAGPGEPTATILQSNPTLDVTCTDPQEAMVDKAKQRTRKKLAEFEADASKVHFVVAGAEQLSASLSANTFDALTACFVLMFADVPRALSEMAKVLKPRGHALLAVWDNMPFFIVNTEIVHSMWADGVPDTHAAKANPPNLTVNPMALSRSIYNTKGDVGELAKKAGFSVESVRDVSYPFMFESMEKMCSASQILTNGVMPALAEATGKTEDNLHAEHCERLKKELHDKYEASWKQSDGTWHFGVGEARVFTMRKERNSAEL